MGITYLVLNKAISKHLAIVFFIIYMSSLILTFNKTGIISFILASTVSVILAPGNFRQHVKRISITAVGLTVAVFAAFSKITAYVNKTGAGSVETLSGRTALWEDTYRQIINGPYIRGFGETAFRAIGPNLAHTAAHNVHPHNEFLAVWFNFGLVGVVLVYSSYLALTIVSWKAFRHGFGHLPILVLCAVVYYFVAGIAAASFSMCLFPIQWLLLYDCLISTHFETHKRSRIPRLI
jgi:O-antigen ligase